MAIPSPRGPSAPSSPTTSARSYRRKSARRKRPNQECRSEEHRQHQNESAAPEGLAMGHLFFIVARLGHDETEQCLVWPRSLAHDIDAIRCGETPIKHGSSDGGLATQRTREIGCAGPLVQPLRRLAVRVQTPDPAAHNRCHWSSVNAPLLCGDVHFVDVGPRLSLSKKCLSPALAKLRS